ncbi:hypothetical protein BDZ45DRAFT_737684 [Acephala macrosclerotiorum]|nr:hypothetical protein BDZ45DRAFT_737684 [Acephala macrosclerotiorum]
MKSPFLSNLLTTSQRQLIKHYLPSEYPQFSGENCIFISNSEYDGINSGLNGSYFFFAFLMAGISYIQNRRTKYSTKGNEEFNTASRSVKSGLIAAGITSAWTWAAKLLQSSTVAYEYDAAGATVQIFLFAVLDYKVKQNAPRCHTFLEIIHTRYGGFYASEDCASLTILSSHDAISFSYDMALDVDSPLLLENLFTNYADQILRRVGTATHIVFIFFAPTTNNTILPTIQHEDAEALEDKATMKDPTRLKEAFRFACISATILTLLMDFIIPLPMFLKHYIFSKGVFIGWVVIRFIWVFFALVTCALLLIWEAMGFFRDFFGGFGRGGKLRKAVQHKHHHTRIDIEAPQSRHCSCTTLSSSSLVAQTILRANILTNILSQTTSSRTIRKEQRDNHSVTSSIDNNRYIHLLPLLPTMMASTSPIRRPLGRLDSNVAPTPSDSWNLPRKITSPKKPGRGGAVLSEDTFREEEGGKAGQQAGVVVGKSLDHHVYLDGPSVKRRRTSRSTSTAVDIQGLDVQEHPQPYGHMVPALEPDERTSRDNENDHGRESNELLLSHFVSLSPESASSPTSSDVVAINDSINDSQNTTITVPDDDFLATWPGRSVPAMAHRPLTPEEIRRKAKEIRLRLSLANYKVRTNQIDVPISRLQIRPSAFPKRTRGVSGISRTPLPSVSIPNINLQQPSAEKIKPAALTIPSSPPSPHLSHIVGNAISPVKRLHDDTRDGLSTPLLPRQRDRLLNPPSLGSPTWNRSDITSSVVKGRAADGLLSLMRQG